MVVLFHQIERNEHTHKPPPEVTRLDGAAQLQRSHHFGLRLRFEAVFGMAGSRRLYGAIRAGRSAALFAEPLPKRQEVADGERGLFGDAQVLRVRPWAGFGVR